MHTQLRVYVSLHPEGTRMHYSRSLLNFCTSAESPPAYGPIVVHVHVAVACRPITALLQRARQQRQLDRCSPRACMKSGDGDSFERSGKEL